MGAAASGGLFRRAKNIIDARRAIAWKMIEGNVGVECRLTVRAFKEKCQGLDTYAGILSWNSTHNFTHA